jgi:dynein heavy chain, axonemal
MPVNQSIVTTVETVRMNALLQLLVHHAKLLMLVRPTGTGKSSYAINFLLKKNNTAVYKLLFINFSAQTSAFIIDLLDFHGYWNIGWESFTGS